MEAKNKEQGEAKEGLPVSLGTETVLTKHWGAGVRWQSSHRRRQMYVC
jgi:hypothetical protein